jgi:hypothetical protein
VSEKAMGKGNELYHEKQRLGHCAVHALNSLFQEDWLNYQIVSNISSELYQSDKETGMLSWYSWNPYAFPIFGYFDIACIVKALERKKCHLSNHVANTEGIDEVCSIESVCESVGILVNEEASSFLGLFSSRHWYSIIYDKDSELFYDMDSKLVTPAIISDVDELKQKLLESIRDRNAHVFVVSHTHDSSES